MTNCGTDTKLYENRGRFWGTTPKNYTEKSISATFHTSTKRLRTDGLTSNSMRLLEQGFHKEPLKIWHLSLYPRDCKLRGVFLGFASFAAGAGTALIPLQRLLFSVNKRGGACRGGSLAPGALVQRIIPVTAERKLESGESLKLFATPA